LLITIYLESAFIAVPSSQLTATSSAECSLGKPPSVIHISLPLLSFAFSALTVLVERQEEHPACKN